MPIDPGNHGVGRCCLPEQFVIETEPNFEVWCRIRLKEGVHTPTLIWVTLDERHDFDPGIFLFGAGKPKNRTPVRSSNYKNIVSTKRVRTQARI